MVDDIVGFFRKHFNSDHPVGLSEKRIIEEYKRERFPEWQRRIGAAYGGPLPMDVNWDQMVKEYKEGYDHPKSIDYAFFVPIEKAFSTIGTDQMGKDALKEKVKKIKITSNKPTNNMEIKLEEGTLWLDVEPPLVEHPDHRYDERIIAVLEKAL